MKKTKKYYREYRYIYECCGEECCYLSASFNQDGSYTPGQYIACCFICGKEKSFVDTNFHIMRMEKQNERPEN